MGLLGGHADHRDLARDWIGRIGQRPKWQDVRMLLHQAAPFAAAGVLYYVYFRIDVVMLSIWRTPDDVGWYNAAYRLVAVLYFIPGSVCSALFSRLSRLAITDRSQHTARARQHYAFSKQLPHYAPAARAKRRAQGNLFAARGRAR